MPCDMRVDDACRDVTGQLRQVTHECVGDAGIRITRMPAFFYRRISIRMTMTITMTAIKMLIGLHLLSRPSRDVGYDQ